MIYIDDIVMIYSGTLIIWTLKTSVEISGIYTHSYSNRTYTCTQNTLIEHTPVLKILKCNSHSILGVQINKGLLHTFMEIKNAFPWIRCKFQLYSGVDSEIPSGISDIYIYLQLLWSAHASVTYMYENIPLYVVYLLCCVSCVMAFFSGMHRKRKEQAIHYLKRRQDPFKILPTHHIVMLTNSKLQCCNFRYIYIHNNFS